MPSPSRSPTDARARPNEPLSSSGPTNPPFDSSIFCCARTLPLLSMKSTQTAPRLSGALCGAPTAKSPIPSPSRSPRDANAKPKVSPAWTAPWKNPRVPSKESSRSTCPFWADANEGSAKQKKNAARLRREAGGRRMGGLRARVRVVASESHGAKAVVLSPSILGPQHARLRGVHPLSRVQHPNSRRANALVCPEPNLPHWLQLRHYGAQTSP